MSSENVSSVRYLSLEISTFPTVHTCAQFRKQSVQGLDRSKGTYRGSQLMLSGTLGGRNPLFHLAGSSLIGSSEI